MLNHYREIRKHDLYARTPIVVFFESNSDWTRSGRGLTDIVTVIPNVEVARHHIGNVSYPGVLTTPTSKPAGATALQRLLYDERLHFATQMISTDPEKHRRQLLEQLRNTDRNRRPPKDPAMQKTRESISGKDNTGAKDDISTSLHQCYYHMIQHEKKQRAIYY